VYRYNPKYFEKSVVDWLAKACDAGVHVDMYVSDVAYWDSVLWNKHLFLPHASGECSEYDVVAILARDTQVARPGARCLWVYSPGESIATHKDTVVFADRSIVMNGAYLQEDNGQWVRTA
jgi:hypothetical protein